MRPRNRPVMVLLGSLALTLIASAQEKSEPNSAPTTPPATLRRPVLDTYHGTRVTDDYRWLEDWANPEVKAWSAAENAYARGILDHLPAVAEVRQRLAELELSDSVDYTGIVRRGDVLFAMKLQPPKQQPFLVLLKSADDTKDERTIGRSERDRRKRQDDH